MMLVVSNTFLPSRFFGLLSLHPRWLPYPPLSPAFFIRSISYSVIGCMFFSCFLLWPHFSSLSMSILTFFYLCLFNSSFCTSLFHRHDLILSLLLPSSDSDSFRGCFHVSMFLPRDSTLKHSVFASHFALTFSLSQLSHSVSHFHIHRYLSLSCRCVVETKTNRRYLHFPYGLNQTL